MKMTNTVKNNAGIYNARIGRAAEDGNVYVFTHRDPKTGDIFADERVKMNNIKENLEGQWLDPNGVRFLEQS